MRHRVLRFFMMMLASTLFACGSAPVNRYYTLTNDSKGKAAELGAPKCALPLVIDSVMAASQYQGEKIVFRADAFEIRYFNYRNWVSPPDEMIMDLLQFRLGESGLFRAAEKRIHSSSVNLALYTKLKAIEEIDRGDDWYARLSMSFAIKTSDEERVVWTHEFDAERKAAHKDVYSVIEALNAVYNEEMDKTLESLSDFVASYPGCRTPAGE